MHGRSFAPLLRGESHDPLHECVVSASFVRLQDGKPPAECVTPALYTERWAYVPAGPHGWPQLYDLTTDPLAEKNLKQEYPEKMAELHTALIDYMRALDAPAEAVAVWENQDIWT